MQDFSLSPHFTLSELSRSDYAIRNGLDNTPPADLLENGYMLAEGLERVRSVLSVPVYVKSAYRSPKVNAGIKGHRQSQHVMFLAADIDPIGMDVRDAMETIIDHEDFVNFDQLIFEGTWIHISFTENPRNEILTANFTNGGTTYSKGFA